MTPFYEECCKDLGWAIDETLLQKMKKANADKLKVCIYSLSYFYLFYSFLVVTRMGHIRDIPRRS